MQESENSSYTNNSNNPTSSELIKNELIKNDSGAGFLKDGSNHLDGILAKHDRGPVPLIVRIRNNDSSCVKVAKTIASDLRINYITAFILAQRGAGNTEEARAFLSPTLRHHLPNPATLKNAEQATDLIVSAIQNKKYITIFSDFDVDGITSASQFWHVLSAAGAKLRHYVPNRLTEGYGLSIEAVEKLHKEKTELLITLDCGITNVIEIKRAKELGLGVIVVDHHEIGPEIPPADIIINPMQDGCPFQEFKMATAGIAWLLCIILIKKLEEANQTVAPLPSSKDLMDLAAIGTICDMVPLTGINRLIASRGLDAIRNAPRPGIKALKEIANLPFGQRFSCSHVSFGIGPRLNAAGRLEDASLGFKLLTSSGSEEVKKAASKIHRLNQERKSLEDHARDICLGMIDKANSTSIEIHNRMPAAYALFDESFHIGVIGIAAQRIVEVVSKPVAVLAPAENLIDNKSYPLLKGSIRSIKEFHVAKALNELSHLLISHGGHAEAGGFSLIPENLNDFCKSFDEIAFEIFKNKPPEKSIKVDSLLAFKDISIQLVQELGSLAPFGIGNPSPLFLSTSVEIDHVQLIGENHIKMQLMQNGETRNAIGWRMRGHPEIIKGKTIDIIYSLELNTYKGISSVQLIVKDILSTFDRI
ncbi:MAG TPA: single-stranded-DNA-specific exonuclease RecJ [Oligoflexia bacterium]|nr:single-stranded-DNA-specific exonuclease RecJ [Oligoflexia bacterium]HMP48587.1 single-stranded-DNA-specific exonuclease RecJ [Oligoflexia bacterium]